MDFFTPCCTSSALEGLGRGLALWLGRWRAAWGCAQNAISNAVKALVLLFACVVAASALAETVPEVSQLRVERGEDGLYLSANLRFDLPPAVEDALLKGIPLVFVAQAEVYRDRWYWYDKQLRQTVRNIRLSYQPLTRRWRLGISQGEAAPSSLALGQSFDNLPDALAAAQRISRWKIADNSEIDPQLRHSIDFHYRLDISQLPRPFQIGAAGQSEWSISVSRNVRPSDSAR